MQISRSKHGLIFHDLDPFFVELLRRILTSADPGHNESARARLYSKPGDDPVSNREWTEFVEPELRHIFETATETVRRDLEALPVAADPATDDHPEPVELRVPAEHFGHWLCGLNQARLALAAKNGFTEADLEDHTPAFNTAREVHLFQIHFYGLLQECLLREQEKRESDSG